MTSHQALHKIVRATKILGWGSFLNNILGGLLLLYLAYWIWWRLEFGFLGIIVFLISFYIVNSIFLPEVFRVYNYYPVQMAKSGAVRLAVLGLISENDILKLKDESVEQWLEIIIISMGKEKFFEIYNEE